VPEGDTVWLTAKRLHGALAGRTLLQSDFRVPQHATADLRGRDVLDVVSRGKHLLTRVDGGLTLHTHLKMEGSWRLFRSGSRWSGGPAWQVRVVLANDEWQAVGYRLGIVELLRTDEELRVVGHLGPDLLRSEGEDGGWDEAEAVRRLTADPAGDVGAAVTAPRAIGEALLDQRCVAGIGTLYRAETLFLAGVSPWAAVDQVDAGKVVRIARRLLLANRDHAQQVTTGNMRRGEEHWVYGRAKRPCRRCGTPISYAKQGTPPRDRDVYWCPTCQPGPLSSTTLTQ
jgi:endonuclease VIII